MYSVRLFIFKLFVLLDCNDELELIILESWSLVIYWTTSGLEESVRKYDRRSYR